jgi:hypothetical protein
MYRSTHLKSLAKKKKIQERDSVNFEIDQISDVIPIFEPSRQSAPYLDA